MQHYTPPDNIMFYLHLWIQKLNKCVCVYMCVCVCVGGRSRYSFPIQRGSQSVLCLQIVSTPRERGFWWRWTDGIILREPGSPLPLFLFPDMLLSLLHVRPHQNTRKDKTAHNDRPQRTRVYHHTTTSHSDTGKLQGHIGGRGNRRGSQGVHRGRRKDKRIAKKTLHFQKHPVCFCGWWFTRQHRW